MKNLAALPPIGNVVTFIEDPSMETRPVRGEVISHWPDGTGAIVSVNGRGTVNLDLTGARITESYTPISTMISNAYAEEIRGY